jgi:preprotein translocase subunit SecD
MANLRSRLLIILGCVLVSAWTLFPRTVIERVKRDGVFVYDTVQRVPLKKGLDLQGGMHLTLEVDESKQAVADKAEALDRALKVIRQRIDEFGVASRSCRRSAPIASSWSSLVSTIPNVRSRSSPKRRFCSSRSPIARRRSSAWSRVSIRRQPRLASRLPRQRRRETRPSASA